VGQEPEELREQIAVKREELSHDLEAIGDRVSPSRVIARRRTAVRMKVGDVRDRVMGTKDAIGDQVQLGARRTSSAVTDSTSRAADKALHRAEGAPLAAGVVGFGLGFVAAAAFPTTRKEREFGEQAQPAVERAAAEIAPAARQIVDEVKPAAQEAAMDLRDEAKSAASSVAQQAKEAAADVRDTAKETAQAKARSSGPG
jgi:hypothetical protein